MSPRVFGLWLRLPSKFLGSVCRECRDGSQRQEIHWSKEQTLDEFSHRLYSTETGGGKLMW